jgi:hypothetical protein
MSTSTYFRPNIHQNGPEILGVKNVMYNQSFVSLFIPNKENLLYEC